ncbi:MAG: restriction endonuclease subunit S [Bacilli bacterium]|nr:restriction endonuclease subunit S [Bacilli bacterium]
MIVEDLKKSILNSAICGKLSFRNKSDSSVDEMIDNITKVRNESIKSKISKNDKYKPIDEKMIFDIPETWRWIRVGEIGNWGSGSTPERGNSDYYNDGTISWLKTGELNDGYVRDSEEKITELALKKCSLKINNPGDVLIAMYGATIGKLGIATVETTTNQACCGCSIYTDVNNKYLFYYLLGIRNKLISMGEGSGQPNISREKIINLPFPLPPIEEQERIVNTIDELFEKLYLIEPIEKELNELNSSFSATLKKSIIQSACSGNLSIQKDNETISDIINVISEKKNKRIKTDFDVVPFLIPSNWSWIKFDDLVEFSIGKTPARADLSFWGKDYPWVSISDMVDDGYISETKEYVSNKAFNDIFKGKISKKGTLIMSFKLTVGRCSILNIDAFHNEGIISIYPYYDSDVLKKYLMKILPFMTKYGDTKGAIKGNTLNSKSLKELLIPLPPIEEQERIVDKIEKLLPLLEDVDDLINC